MPRIVHLEARRYLVPSDEDPELSYLVDLDELGGNGWCGCPDFEFRRWHDLKTGNKPGGLTRCKHIARAMANETKRKRNDDNETCAQEVPT